MKAYFISEPGRLVRRDGGLAFVDKDGKVEYLANMYDVIIIASSKVSVTSAAMRLLGRYNVELVVLEWNGEPSIRVSSLVPNKTAETRLKQYEVIIRNNAIKYVKPIIIRKIIEQGRSLRRIAKAKRIKWLRDQSYEVEVLAQEVSKSNDFDSLRAVEAKAAKLYWGLISTIFTEFPGREHESSDPYNQALNYAYGILYAFCDKALEITGLDPYAGFFHTMKSGKRSLTFDFSEQFKPLVDSTIFLKIKPKNIHIDGNGLTYSSRKEIARIVRGILEECDKVLLTEAWSLASSLRREEPYVPGWKACT